VLPGEVPGLAHADVKGFLFELAPGDVHRLRAM
jgi:hypothetical protein